MLKRVRSGHSKQRKGQVRNSRECSGNCRQLAYFCKKATKWEEMRLDRWARPDQEGVVPC